MTPMQWAAAALLVSGGLAAAHYFNTRPPTLPGRTAPASFNATHLKDAATVVDRIVERMLAVSEVPDLPSDFDINLHPIYRRLTAHLDGLDARSGTSAPTTIVGPKGVGKTTAMAYVCHQRPSVWLGGWFSPGVNDDVMDVLFQLLTKGVPGVPAKLPTEEKVALIRSAMKQFASKRRSAAPQVSGGLVIAIDIAFQPHENDDSRRQMQRQLKRLADETQAHVIFTRYDGQFVMEPEPEAKNLRPTVMVMEELPVEVSRAVLRRRFPQWPEDALDRTLRTRARTLPVLRSITSPVTAIEEQKWCQSTAQRTIAAFNVACGKDAKAVLTGLLEEGAYPWSLMQQQCHRAESRLMTPNYVGLVPDFGAGDDPRVSFQFDYFRSALSKEHFPR